MTSALEEASQSDVADTIATHRASTRERRAGLALVLALVVCTVAGLVLIGGEQVVPIPFITIFAGSAGMADAISAALLFSLYRTDRQRIVLFAATAYLVNAILVVPYTLTFPDVFESYGFIGNEQSAAFIWVAWHYTFALTIGCGTLVASKEIRRNFGVRIILAAVVLAIAISLAATLGRDHLPLFLQRRHFSDGFRWLAVGASILNMFVAVLLNRPTVLSSLRLWLIIALIASALDAGLNGLTPARFSATWVIGKFEQFVTASVVLISLFGAWSSIHIQTKRLTARLLRAREQERVLRTGFDREHRASTAFQEAALPTSLPTVAGIAFDAVYRAADAEAMVGGDWYDAFLLEDGRLVVSVGDVMGSGLAAAVQMNAMRQVVRGAAQLDPDPVAILDAADRVLRSERPGSIVTAFIGVVDPETHACSFASAGHPPALLRQSDGRIERLGNSGLPLGLREMSIATQGTQTILLPDDGILVLYTDGLTEITRDVIAGEDRLCRFLAGELLLLATNPATSISDALADKAQDDIAILTVAILAQAR